MVPFGETEKMTTWRKTMRRRRSRWSCPMQIEVSESEVSAWTGSGGAMPRRRPEAERQKTRALAGFLENLVAGFLETRTAGGGRGEGRIGWEARSGGVLGEVARVRRRWKPGGGGLDGGRRREAGRDAWRLGVAAAGDGRRSEARVRDRCDRDRVPYWAANRL